MRNFIFKVNNSKIYKYMITILVLIVVNVFSIYSHFLTIPYVISLSSHKMIFVVTALQLVLLGIILAILVGFVKAFKEYLNNLKDMSNQFCIKCKDEISNSIAQFSINSEDDLLRLKEQTLQCLLRCQKDYFAQNNLDIPAIVDLLIVSKNDMQKIIENICKEKVNEYK